MRWAAIIHLGRSFTVDVAIANSATLKNDGFYKLVRHPGYLGLLLIILVFGLLMGAWFSFLSLFIPVFCTIIYRISVEEKVLKLEFGEIYSNYARRNRRIVPGVY